jgi:hypothetical protein
VTYVKQTWINSDLTKPINAVRLNHIEDGIEAVSTQVDNLGGGVAGSSAPAFPNIYTEFGKTGGI